MLYSEWKVYEHISKALSLYRVPSQTFNADVVARLSELFAFESNFMPLKFNPLWIPIVSGSQECACSIQIHLLSTVKGGAVNCHVLGQVEVEVLV